MNKDPKDNVKAIRKDIKISTEEEVLEPLQPIVDALERLLVKAKEGSLRELCYVTSYNDQVSDRQIVGEPNNFNLVQNQLRILDMEYFEGVVYPNMGGFNLEDLLDELE